MKRMQKVAVTSMLLVMGAGAFAANPAYTRKRAIYDEMDQIRSVEALAVTAPLDKRAAHSKRWAAVVAAAEREFGQYHSCSRSASLSQSSWQQLNGNVDAHRAASAAKLAWQAGNAATSCYDEIEKLDSVRPVILKK